MRQSLSNSMARRSIRDVSFTGKNKSMIGNSVITDQSERLRENLNTWKKKADRKVKK